MLSLKIGAKKLLQQLIIADGFTGCFKNIVLKTFTEMVYSLDSDEYQ